jgi:hypothetical protein
VAEAVAQGTYRVIEGQSHAVQPEMLAPVLVEFFTA